MVAESRALLLSTSYDWRFNYDLTNSSWRIQRRIRSLQWRPQPAGRWRVCMLSQHHVQRPSRGKIHAMLIASPRWLGRTLRRIVANKERYYGACRLIEGTWLISRLESPRHAPWHLPTISAKKEGFATIEQRHGVTYDRPL